MSLDSAATMTFVTCSTSLLMSPVKFRISASLMMLFRSALPRTRLFCTGYNLIVVFNDITTGKESLQSFSILGDWISLVKINETAQSITEKSEGRMDSDRSSTSLGKNLEDFFNNYIIRLTLPNGIKAKINGDSREFGSLVDISLGRAIGEARKKVKLKHMMNMMMSGMMSKAAVFGPLLMMIIKIKAFKALVLSMIALVLSKIQLFKMLMKGKGNSKELIILHETHGGGGGGGSWSSGDDGGHDSYGPPSDSGGGHGGSGGHGGGSGGWSSGGEIFSGGGYGGGGGGVGGGGGGSWASASGDSYSSADGGHGGGGGGWGGGWASRKYDPTWLVYRSNRTDTKLSKQKR
ncbi:uncharacterized protein LOC142317813 [Lycorma delicatula]|uniref:uncharacterized protein LOC142317813 n=1 Tax=Lycorma delicatula TaxID=130591 RepID=UPI003F51A35A